MKKLRRSYNSGSNKGTAIMMKKLKYSISAIIVLCAIAIGVLAIFGPKQDLQITNIDPKAMAYIQSHNLLNSDEKVTGYKATGYYNYSQGIVMTSERIFIYQHNKVHSIPLEKISMFVIKDTELGHQEVLVSAAVDGAIGFEVRKSRVPELISLLKINSSIIRDHSKGHKLTPEKM